MKDHDKDKCHTEQNNTSDQGKYYVLTLLDEVYIVCYY